MTPNAINCAERHWTGLPYRARGCAFAWKRLANRLRQGIQSRFYSTSIVAGTNSRNDFVLNDSISEKVWNLRFEPVPNFDSKAAILRHNEERHTVVDTLTTHSPSFERTIGPIFNRNLTGGLADPNNQLMLSLFFVRAQAGIQPLEVGGREESCGVGHPLRGRRRDRNILPGNAWRKEADQY